MATPFTAAITGLLMLKRLVKPRSPGAWGRAAPFRLIAQVVAGTEGSVPGAGDDGYPEVRVGVEALNTSPSSKLPADGARSCAPAG